MKKLFLHGPLAVLMLAIALSGCGGGPSPSTYSVTYDGNGSTGGTIPVDANHYEQGQTVAILGNTGNLLNIDGATTAYRFAGWNTQADGLGTDYGDGATYTMGDSDVTLYAKWVPYALRDTGPAGGLIFFIKSGGYSDGWRYLEAAPSDQSDGLPLTDGTFGHTEAHGIVVGTGQANTNLIVDLCGSGSYAAKICDDLVFGGYDDWFLPSKGELEAMYSVLKQNGLGDFTADYYWSSTEYDLLTGYCILMSIDMMSIVDKSVQHRVRAVRDF